MDIIDKPKERKVTLRRKLFWVLGVVVLYNVLARLLFANIGWGVCASLLPAKAPTYLTVLLLATSSLFMLKLDSN